MSHWSKTKVQMSCLETLKKAVSAMGFGWQGNMTIRGHQYAESFAVRSNTVGVTQEQDGMLALHCDAMYVDGPDELGRNFSRLKNYYVAAHLAQQAEAQGAEFSFQEQGDKVICVAEM